MREMKFRCWSKKHAKMWAWELDGVKQFDTDKEIYNPDSILMQFTGLKDKNGLAEIYEGDIIDANGTLKGNIYESPQIYQEGIDCLIEGMGTEAWRNTESIAVGRGCKYTKQ